MIGDKQMKILKPEFPEPLQKLVLTEDYLDEARLKERDVEHKQIGNTSFQEVDLSRQCFRNTVFENCKFIDCDFRKTEFIDTRFSLCDFSNSNLENVYFNRCEMVSSKGVGMNCLRAFFKNFFAADCNFGYTNFTSAKLQNNSFLRCDFSNTEFGECRFKDLVFDASVFLRAVFFKTPLKKIDMTTCYIAGITVTPEDLSGMIVTAAQAAELAKLMGLVVM